MPDKLGYIRKSCFQWAGHAWKKDVALIRSMFQSNVPKRKISLGNPRKKWEDLIRCDVENVRSGGRIGKNWQ